MLKCNQSHSVCAHDSCYNQKNFIAATSPAFRNLVGFELFKGPDSSCRYVSHSSAIVDLCHKAFGCLMPLCTVRIYRLLSFIRSV